MWFVGGYVEDRASEQSGGLTGWLLVAGFVVKRFGIRRGKCMLCSISGGIAKLA